MGQLDLNAAVVLLRVVQAGSFRGAARLLGMPKSNVSRKVADLEEHLGALLLHRTTRKLSLTDAGAAFVEHAEGALAHLEAAEHSVSELQKEPRGRLRVTAAVNLGQTLLAPLLAEFLLAYPAVEVALHLTDRHVDLVAERFDVALRVGALPDSSLVSQLVGRSVFRIVASPSYLKAHGTPRKPADLAAHDCLVFAKTGAAPRGTWPLGRASRVREVRVAGRLVADDFTALREAALRGVGIARLPALHIDALIREGELVPVLEEYAPPAMPLQLVHLGGPHMPPRTRVFLEFMRPRLTRVLG
jgi:DNA-binding transcriptional LysR family regulator